LAGHRIDSNLTAEKQLILVAEVEIEHSRVLQEERTLLGYEYFEWREIEWLKIDFGIGEVCVTGKIQDEVRTEAVFDIESAGQRELGVLPCLFVILNQSVGFYDKKSSASDIGYPRQVPCFRDFRDYESSSVRAPKILFILSANESLQIQTPNNRV
jgi:hypothetical protein